MCIRDRLKRTIQTAKALSKFINFEDITEAKDLVEQNFGDWAGKRISDVWEELKHNKSQHNFSFICPEICPPNGDSYLDQCKRVANFIDNFNFENKNSEKDFDKAAEDLRLATRYLGIIVGKVDIEEILGSIFNDFCIGK